MILTITTWSFLWYIVSIACAAFTLGILFARWNYMAIIEKQTAFIDEKRGGTIVTKIPKEHAEAFTELRDWCEKWKVCLFSSDENRMTRLYVNFLGNDLNSYYQVYYNIPLPSLNILRVDREHLDVRKPIPWEPDKEGPPKALKEWTEWKKKSSEEEK